FRSVELQLTDRGRVLRAVGEERLFGCNEVAKIRLHRREVRLALCVRELRDRDRGQNTDNDDHDQQLDEGKAFAKSLHVCLPEGVGITCRRAFQRVRTWQRLDPIGVRTLSGVLNTTCGYPVG